MNCLEIDYPMNILNENGEILYKDVYIQKKEKNMDYFKMDEIEKWSYTKCVNEEKKEKSYFWITLKNKKEVCIFGEELDFLINEQIDFKNDEEYDALKFFLIGWIYTFASNNKETINFENLANAIKFNIVAIDANKKIIYDNREQ